MRLWSLHPRYLDRQGLTALWREGLLARAVHALKARAARATVLIEEGDLTHLLPKLRLGELDLFVGRLEPGYAAPDLQTEALFEEPMVVVAAPGSEMMVSAAASSIFSTFAGPRFFWSFRLSAQPQASSRSADASPIGPP